MSVIVPTQEQESIKAKAKTTENMKISAAAGAAKTSTLVMVAEEAPVNSLMLTFNKALAIEAAGKFPSHVECRTTHSLAYGVFGAQLQHKLKRPKGAYRNVAGTGTEIAKYFKTGDYIYMLEGERETRKIKQGGVGVAIKETVNRFEQSAEREMDTSHVSVNVCDTAMIRDVKAMRGFRNYILGFAQKLWKLRKDPASDILATHDTYLKLYQLSNPDLSRWKSLYLDEMQDTNAVTLDIFMQQLGRCNLYAVGDKFQSIYQWRGAINAMEQLDWEECHLTKSFRFGPRVAALANAVLADNGKMITEIQGWEERDTQIYHPEDIPQEVLDQPHAMLFRTNGALIFEAVRLMEQGKVVNLEIDVSDFTKLLESAIELFRGNMFKVKHENLLQFESWEEFGIEAELIKGEMLRVFKMVESGSVYKVLSLLASHQNVPNPDIWMTTGHKGKGREWDIVILAEDFPSPWNDKGEWVGLQDMERNLLYVSLTRAMKVLCYNQSVAEMIERVVRQGKCDDPIILEAHKRTSQHYAIDSDEHMIQDEIRELGKLLAL